jgi:hypothetical protein
MNFKHTTDIEKLLCGDFQKKNGKICSMRSIIVFAETTVMYFYDLPDREKTKNGL